MFATASAITQLSPGHYAAVVDPSWFQGPGAYGGLSGALLLRAMSSEARGRPARSLTAQFAVPVAAGPVAVEATVEKGGTTMSFASARLVQGGVRVHAVGAFGLDRSVDFDEDHERMPDTAPPEEVPAMPWMTGLPVFLRHFEIRLVHGAPYAGAARSGVRAWLRSEDVEVLDAPLIAGLLDVLPPAVLPRATVIRPLSTVVWHVHFLADEPLDGGEHVLADVTTQVTRGGYSDQETRLFSRRGKLLAYGRQLVAVVR